MENFERKIERTHIDDIRSVQRLVIANSFENLRFGSALDSVILTNGVMVRADALEGKSKPGLNKKAEMHADVECAEPVPPLDAVTPLIRQLILGKRDFFTVKTSDKNDWITVRFARDPLSAKRQIKDSRDSLNKVL
jgi:hypothetical protein